MQIEGNPFYIEHQHIILSRIHDVSYVLLRKSIAIHYQSVVAQTIEEHKIFTHTINRTTKYTFSVSFCISQLVDIVVVTTK